MRLKGLILMLCGAMTCCGGGVSRSEVKPVVEIEEDVYTYVDSDNGSFPLWTYGSTILARAGDDLFFSATETIPDAEPLNCVRWALMKRTPSGWEVQQSDLAGHTRENCPEPPVGCHGPEKNISSPTSC